MGHRKITSCDISINSEQRIELIKFFLLKIEFLLLVFFSRIFSAYCQYHLSRFFEFRTAYTHTHTHQIEEHHEQTRKEILLTLVTDSG